MLVLLCKKDGMKIAVKSNILSVVQKQTYLHMRISK